MSDIGDKMDVTVQLPDEVLCHVFSFLSPKHKYRLETINHKFQRCVHKELKDKPQELLLDFSRRKMNGYHMRNNDWEERFFDGIRTLAKKAKFIGIWADFDFGRENVEKLDRVLSLLMAESQCLTKVRWLELTSGCSQAVLEYFVDKCDKLSMVCYNFLTCSLNSEPDRSAFPLDLCQLFKNRGLTELDFKLFRYHQEGLVDLFAGIKPNTLRKLELVFQNDMPGLNMAQLVKALGPNATALEDIYLVFRRVRVELVDLFESLAQLPALHTCDIHFSDVQLGDQFVAAMTALFIVRDFTMTVSSGDHCFPPNLPGCQMANMIRQIQSVRPGLVVDFDHSATRVLLSLGKASFVKSDFQLTEHCGAEDCIQCQSFYPSLLCFLHSRARRVAVVDFVAAQHLPNCFLDRCRIDQCLDDLKELTTNYFYYRQYGLKPWSVEANEDQQSVTITFNMSDTREHLFSFTVSCGRCLTNGCIKCTN